MPRAGITAYDLLISCPGDVEKYIEVVKECLEGFNTVIGRINNAEIVGRHWSTDSYAQSGDKPQELLNQQFVRDCDAAVAIFWTRFGTPTDKYGSGTEEEIEEMLSANKQVFMYFVDEPIPMSGVDLEQYKKVQGFREKYKDKGIYFVVKDVEELRKLFTNHLSLHFLPIIVGEKTMNIKETKSPLLSIHGINHIADNKADIFCTSYTDSKFIKTLEEKILTKIGKEKGNKLEKRKADEIKPKQEVAETRDENFIRLQEAFKNVDFLKGLTTNADIPEEWKQVIIAFCNRFDVIIEEDFWNVGNLKISQSLVNPMLGGGSSLSGEDDEKIHYKEIRDIYWKIKELNEYRQYLGDLDSYKMVEFIVSNDGTTYDEDIDIKLIVPKGKIVNKKKLPIPGINIIDTLLEMQFMKSAFQIKATDEIDSYCEYSAMPTRFEYTFTNPLNPPSAQEEYESSKTKYMDEINQLFCYELFEKEDCDVLTFHLNYLKHNTRMAFPSVLIFHDVPESIDYEMISKHSPDVIKGKIEIA